MATTGKRIRKQYNRAHIPAINLPDYGPGVTHTIIGKHILFVTVEYDGDMPNPCEDQDGFGLIRSLSNRHINNIAYDEAKALLESDPDVIPLSYFEHGQSWWGVAELPAPAGVEFQWDGVQFAGIWIPDACVRESYTGQDGLSRRDWMVQQAKAACETYTDWVNGNVYYYRVQAYKLRSEDGDAYTDARDYRKATEVFEDSCGGFYGYDYFKDEVVSVVRQALDELGFSQRAISKALPVKGVQ